MNTWTEAEIALCRRLHELLKAKGELPEIREGDWITDEKYLNTPSLINADNAIFILNNAKKERKRYILLWTWERCREWLWEHGWHISWHADLFNRISRNILIKMGEKDKSSDDRKYKEGAGQTDLEAILAVIIQVAEER